MAPWKLTFNLTDKEVIRLIKQHGFWERIVLMQAFIVASLLHFGQTRRLEEKRYIEHPKEVFYLALQDKDSSLTLKAATFLHDSIEENKGLMRIIAILAILMVGPSVSIYVFVMTNWYKDDRRYFAQIVFWALFFPEIPKLKLYDKKAVLSSPWERNREIKCVKQVLGSFSEMVEDCAKRMSRRHAYKFMRNWKQIKVYAEKRIEALGEKTAA